MCASWYDVVRPFPSTNQMIEKLKNECKADAKYREHDEQFFPFNVYMHNVRMLWRGKSRGFFFGSCFLNSNSSFESFQWK